MFLFEVLSSPMPWKWTEQSEDMYRASFDSNGMPYQVTLAFDDEDKHWIVTFAPVRQVQKKRLGFLNKSEEQKTFGITGTGNSQAVLSTVKDIVQAFKKKFPSFPIKFAAVEPNRQRLYTSMVKRYAPNADIRQNDRGHAEYRLQ